MKMKANEWYDVNEPLFIVRGTGKTQLNFKLTKISSDIQEGFLLPYNTEFEFEF